MHGYHLFENGICPIGINGVYFGLWHYVILISIILIFVAIIYSKKNNNISKNEALNLLKKMYVNGELSDEEYINKKNILEKK